MARSSGSSTEAQVRACYSTWSQTYYDEYYGRDAGYPPVHARLLKRLLRETGTKTLLDAGCGPASFLRLVPREVDVFGFDLTPEMVDEARRVLRRRGVPANHLWQGSVVAARAFRPPRGGASKFDSAISIGVLPHLQPDADMVVLRNLRNAVRPGGLVVVEARNQLFSLFTLNRYSYQFFVEELVRVDDLRERAGRSTAGLQAALEKVKRQFRLDLPPVRTGRRGEPGYDEVVSRTHNPFALQAMFARLGFSQVRTLFYHYHCLPPICQSDVPKLFRRRSLAMENPYDWRGHFMASAFLVAGVRR